MGTRGDGGGFGEAAEGQEPAALLAGEGEADDEHQLDPAGRRRRLEDEPTGRRRRGRDGRGRFGSGPQAQEPGEGQDQA